MDYPTGYGKRPLWQWLVIYLIIGALVYGVIYYFFLGKKSASPYQATASQTPAQTTGLPADRSPLSGVQAGQSTVTITPSGFQPGSLTIKSGETVVWSNQGGGTGNVSSSPHPTHTDYPPLNLGDVAPGASVSLVFPTAGTYKYHNHLNPSQFGSIIVQ